MARWRSVLLVAACAVGFSGCPLAMNNDYKIVGSSAGGAGGSSGASDAAGATAGSAGLPDASTDGGGSGGGASGSGGSGGSAGVSGSAGGPSDAGVGCDGCSGVCCNNVCVDTNTDPANCGGCGAACSVGRSCLFGKCQVGWVASTANPPSGFVPREKAAYAWTGSQIFIWGGEDGSGNALGDGALYNPATDTWSKVAQDVNAPSPRVLATAVAVGNVVVVWGGGDPGGTTDYQDGAAYDLLGRVWTKLSSAGATPPAERAPGGWNASGQLLFWGGWTKSQVPVAGAFVYTLAGGSWSKASTNNDPGALLYAATGWSGTKLYVDGGQPNGAGRTDHCYEYTQAADSWTTLPNGPNQRYGAFGTWDGQAFVVWGGTDGTNVMNDGQYFSGNTWTHMSTSGAPTARWAPVRQSGWSARIADGKTLILGGSGSSPGSFMTDGAIYNRTSDSWTPVQSWPSSEDHEWGVGVWTGSEFVLWGGRNGAQVTASLERYAP